MGGPLLSGRKRGFCLAEGMDIPLFTGATGEFCLAAPPTKTCLLGPPTELWAAVGYQEEGPIRIEIITIAIAPFFMIAFPFERVANREF
jgi:hypothetical protein